MFMSDISIIIRKMRVYAERCGAPFGLGFPEQVVMMYLKANGTCSQTAIAKDLDIDKGAIAKTVAKLEEKGMVERQVNPDNKREKQVQLLPQGVKHMNNIAHSYQELESLLFAGFQPEEKAVALDAIHTIASNASQVEEG